MSMDMDTDTDSDFEALTELDVLIPNMADVLPLPESRSNSKPAQDAHKRALKAQKLVEQLQGPHEKLKQGVKRKISEIVVASAEKKPVVAGELLNLVIEQRGNLSKMHKASKTCLLDQFKCGALPEKLYVEGLRDVQQKERKLFAGDVTIDRSRERILRNIQGLISQNSKNERTAGRKIAQLFLNILAHKNVDREAEQNMFRQDLIGHYQCQPDGRGTEIWCPIYQDWYSHKRVRAAHIVPYTLGYKAMGDLFGRTGHGHELMWSVGNGLMMHADFEDAFDEHVFVLVPVEKPGQPDGWKLILIDEAKRHQKGKPTWDFLDGRELVFLNDERPARRFLYFHYVMSVFKAIQEQTTGWQTARDKSGTRQAWATPGRYLRTSMLRELALAFGDDVKLPEQLLADGEIGDAEPVEKEVERQDVKDLASALLSMDDFSVASKE